jgi:hypothetical protein
MGPGALECEEVRDVEIVPVEATPELVWKNN